MQATGGGVLNGVAAIFIPPPLLGGIPELSPQTLRASSSPLRKSSFGADTAFSLTRSPSVGFSLIFSMGYHAARSEGFVVIKR